jgi:hypothetical protein
MMDAPLAAVEAGFVAGSRSAVELRVGVPPVVVDAADPAGPNPTQLLVGAHAADVAAAARAHLERDGDPGDVTVVATLDEGAPPLLYRRVQVPVRLRPDDAARLVKALDHTDTTRLLGPAFTVRTVVEYQGEALY